MTGIVFHLHTDNICYVNCTFCAFYRHKKDDGAYVLSYEQIYEKIEELLAIQTTLGDQEHFVLRGDKATPEAVVRRIAHHLAALEPVQTSARTAFQAA